VRRAAARAARTRGCAAGDWTPATSLSALMAQIRAFVCE
jgi:hypothetical protein